MDRPCGQGRESEQESRIIESSYMAFPPSSSAPRKDEILDLPKLTKHFRTARRRLIVLDYDGTLTPLVDNPEAAVPSYELLRLLEDLVRDRKTEVWLVSGRKQSFLDQHFGRIKLLGLAAEHGCFVRYPGEEWGLFLEILDTSWIDEVVQPIFERLTGEIPGSEVERKEFAIVWHYRNADQVVGLEKAKEIQAYLQDKLQLCEVDVMLGSNILEVKPQAINKGTLVSVLLYNCFEGIPTDRIFVFCVGDDTTDEDMFRLLQDEQNYFQERHIYSCQVSDIPKRTSAQYRIHTPQDVRWILRHFFMFTAGSQFSPS